MTLERLLQIYLQSARVCHLEATTQRGYRSIYNHLIRALGGQLPVVSLDNSHLAELLKYLQARGYSGTVKYLCLCATRLLFRWAVEQGYLTKEPAQLQRLPRCPRPAAWVPSPEQVLQLLEAPGPGRLGQRDRFLFELLYGTGLRRTEACALNCSDIEPDTAGIWVRQGKGSKDRLQPLGPYLQKLLKVYLDQVRPLLRPSPLEDALLLTRHGGRFKNKNLDGTLRKYALRLALPNLATHSLRRAFATHMLLRGAPLSEVQRLLGHESPETTMRYTQIEVHDVQREFLRTHPRARRKKPRAARV